MTTIHRSFWMLLILPALLLGTLGCETMREHKIASGATIGAATGALAGGIIGHQSGHRTGGAVIGGLAGAAIGGGVGYALERRAKKYEKVEDVYIETVEPVATNEPTATVQPAPHVRLRLSNEVLFDQGSSALKPAGAEKIRQIADIMKQDLYTKVIVRGFASSEGADETNMALSQRRAETVANELAYNDVDPRRITAMGMGESYPIADNATEAGRMQNRRVEIEIFPPEEN